MQPPAHRNIRVLRGIKPRPDLCLTGENLTNGAQAPGRNIRLVVIAPIDCGRPY
jgi:hypothetical protein